MRLQIDARVGTRIMEYLWPARRERQIAADPVGNEDFVQVLEVPEGRTSLDSPRGLHSFRDTNKGELAPPLRKLGTSRSFTDLRGTKDAAQVPALHKMHSSEALHDAADGRTKTKKAGDAAEMKTRASQKSFVLVRISR